MDFNCAAPRKPPPIRSFTQARFRVTTKKQKTNQPWSEATELILSSEQQSCQAAFWNRPPFLHAFSLRFSSQDFPFTPNYPLLPLTSLSSFDFLTLSLSFSALPVFLPPSLPLCHSAHLGCLVELGTSVPVRGAQWGPVEDTKGGLLQLSVTLRPTQQLFGVYSSVLNPHTQPYHKGTSLAPAQRSPLFTPS